MDFAKPKRGMGFSFDEDSEARVGQSQRDVLVVVEVDEFLGVRASGNEDAPIEPDEPDRNEMGSTVTAHSGKPNC